MIVNKIWHLGDKNVKVEVFVVDKTRVKFKIKDSRVRSRALRRGMWNILGVPMIVSKWSPITEDAQPEMKSIPM